MASSYPRKSLKDVFDIQIPSSSSSKPRSLSPSKLRVPLRNIIQQSISKADFPSWKTLRGLSKVTAEPTSFTLKRNSGYSSLRGNEPDKNFDECASMIWDLRILLSGNHDAGFIETYQRFTHDQMSRLVFGSNMIERAGLNLDITLKLCGRVFDGEDVRVDDIDPRSPEYAASLSSIADIKGIRSPNLGYVHRSRAEIIQHAQALKYITDAALDRDLPLTEELILETHRILTKGLLPDHQVGQYRTIICGIKSLDPKQTKADGTRKWDPEFCAPSTIPGHMKTFINGFNKDIKEREESGDMDPFYLAADICQDFVAIHPFVDGNGRMCRLIANAYLIKYAGVMITIGEDRDDRSEYIRIVRLSSENCWEKEEEAKGELAHLFLNKAHATLKAMKAKLGRPSH